MWHQKAVGVSDLVLIQSSEMGKIVRSAFITFIGWIPTYEILKDLQIHHFSRKWIYEFQTLKKCIMYVKLS